MRFLKLTLQEDLRPTKIINQHIAKVSLDQLQVIKVKTNCLFLAINK